MTSVMEAKVNARAADAAGAPIGSVGGSVAATGSNALDDAGGSAVASGANEDEKSRRRPLKSW